MEKSITLIGLPGCGKTTVGNLLSDKLKYEFVDIDFYIENKQQKSIIELFRNGEDYLKVGCIPGTKDIINMYPSKYSPIKKVRS